MPNVQLMSFLVITIFLVVYSLYVYIGGQEVNILLTIYLCIPSL
jgi:hypothetical protein